MIRPELLLPAGNIEKMKYAFAYGSDAVYLGVSDYSLRNTHQGDIVTKDNLFDAVNYAHKLNKKIYVTVNIYPHNKDIENLPEFLELLETLQPDSIIFSDIGVGTLAKKYSPTVPLHLSTQANTCNYVTAKAWQDFGVSRIILARELSLNEIATIKQKTPELELEVFIHGSLCISYSGRCLLSDYMTDNKRKSNQGECAQACRWQYYLMEETRSGEYFNIIEDDRYTYIMNSKDLCLAEYIKNLMEIGIDSFKVEGRTKSPYYVAVVAKVYREIINKILNNQEFDVSPYVIELMTVGNRGFTTNFLVDKPKNIDYNYLTSKGKADRTFLAVSISDTINNGKLLIRAKNQFKLFDKVEWITPNNSYLDEIRVIEDQVGEKLAVANTNNEVHVNVPKSFEDCRLVILRSRG